MDEAPRQTLFGRRKGRPLRQRQSSLLATRLPDLRVDLDARPPQPVTGLFAAAVTGVRLEIGFGGGEHLRHEARAAPDIGFLGVEPFQNGMARMVSAVADDALANIRLFDGDAAVLLDWLPPASLLRADLLYPDPWPKRRHWRRRFVSDENLSRLARALIPGGEFRVASDIADYIDWTLRLVGARAEFAWTAERADDWRRPWAGWPGTRYEAKALKAARVPAYLIFRRA